MTRNYETALKIQKSKTLQTQLEIYGTLGIPLGGERVVEVTFEIIKMK